MPEILAEAIDANIREARRAGDILGRMRAYIGGTPVAPRAWPLRKALEDALQSDPPDAGTEHLMCLRPATLTPLPVPARTSNGVGYSAEHLVA